MCLISSQRESMRDAELFAAPLMMSQRLKTSTRVTSNESH